MKITLDILKILIYFFLQNIMVWGALSFNNDNTYIYFGLTCPLNKLSIWIPWSHVSCIFITWVNIMHNVANHCSIGLRKKWLKKTCQKYSGNCFQLLVLYLTVRRFLCIFRDLSNSAICWCPKVDLLDLQIPSTQIFTRHRREQQGIIKRAMEIGNQEAQACTVPIKVWDLEIVDGQGSWGDYRS